MSTLAYAGLTTIREDAKSGTSETTGSPGVKTYVDALAALVPAEVLTLHGLMLTVTTQVAGSVTTIRDSRELAWAFVGLLIISAVLYVVPRWMDRRWGSLDYCRVLIPPLAFIGWTMLQRATAFDAVITEMRWTLNDAARTVIALLGAFALGILATCLAFQADNKPPPNSSQ